MDSNPLLKRAQTQVRRSLLSAVTRQLFEEAKSNKQAAITDLCTRNAQLHANTGKKATPSFMFNGKLYVGYHHDPKAKTIGGVPYKKLTVVLHHSLRVEAEQVLQKSFHDQGNELNVENYVGECLRFMQHPGDLLQVGIPSTAVPDWAYSEEVQKIFPYSTYVDADYEQFIAQHQSGFLAIKRLFLFNIITNK